VDGGQLQYTPAGDYNGPDSFTYRASDGVLNSAPAAVSVTVRPVNDAPVCQEVNLNTEEDTVGTALPRCSDIDGDSLGYAIASQPTHGSAAVVNGQLQYTPEADYNGLDSFTYRANDERLDSAPAVVNVSVGTANDLPTAVDDTAITDEDVPVLIEVLDNDSDPDGGVLSVTGASDPAHGEVVVHADGTITYTPDENYSGQDGFSYQISDGQGGAAQALATVTVIPVNDAPIAVADSYQTRYMTPLEVSSLEGLLVNDSDIEGDPLAAVLVSGPAHGQVSLNPDGSFTYTPGASATDLDVFTYTITDGEASSVSVTVTIAIQTQKLYLPLVMK
jgi:VCBS repeat-containing protein